AVPEPSLAAWVLDDPVEGDVLADHDLSHLDSPCIRGAPRPGTASNRADATARPDRAAQHRPIRQTDGVFIVERAERAPRKEEKRGCMAIEMDTTDLI